MSVRQHASVGDTIVVANVLAELSKSVGGVFYGVAHSNSYATDVVVIADSLLVAKPEQQPQRLLEKCLASFVGAACVVTRRVLRRDQSGPENLLFQGFASFSTGWIGHTMEPTQ